MIFAFVPALHFSQGGGWLLVTGHAQRALVLRSCPSSQSPLTACFLAKQEEDPEWHAPPDF